VAGRTIRKVATPKKNLIERRKKVFGPEHLGTLYAQADLALDLFAEGHFEEGRMLAGELVPVMRKVLGSTDRRTLNAISNLARCDAATGRTSEAIALLEECAPQMRDDTFINLLLAHLQLWCGLDEKYNETRRWMLDYAKENRDRFRARPDILERLVLIACLAPLENASQGEEIQATLARCREIRATSGGPPGRGPGPAWRSLITGIAHYRVGDYEKAEAELVETLRLLDEADKGDYSPMKRERANLYRAMSMLAQGKTDAARQLYSETIRTITPPPSAEQPLLNNPEPAGHPIIVWLAQREAQSLFDLARENAASPKNAPGQK
jgi:tetratricopeptide (TPR) repeat protein